MGVEVNPDVVIIDSALPDFMRGVRILNRLSEVKNIPVVILCDRDEPVDEYFAAGVDDFLFRPYSFIDLRYRLKVALQLGDTLKTIKNQNQLLHKTSEELKKQYRLLEEQRKDMIDDITYSRRIQNAIMPSLRFCPVILMITFCFIVPSALSVEIFTG